MPYNPNWPQHGEKLTSFQLREQWNGVAALAQQPGPQGPAGKDGQDGKDGRDGVDGQPGANGADGTPGANGSDGRSIAEVYDSGDGRAMVRMSDGATYGPFTIASGPAGPQGERGSDGGQGPTGNDGRGIAEVYDSGDGRAMVRLTDGSTFGPFTVAGGPQGQQGSNGNDGRGITNIRDNGDGTLSVDMSDGSSQGPFAMPAGPAGPQGPQGEVSAADLSFAIGGTSANSNTVQPLDTSADLPTTIAKLNELINALRR